VRTAGKPLTVYGEGTQTRSFQYVSDLINGIITVMESDQIGPFNIGNPGEFTMIELVRERSLTEGTEASWLGEYGTLIYHGWILDSE
jgi:nucleoside-diphosphate-sugar epimerase